MENKEKDLADIFILGGNLISIESELATHIYRMRDLHNDFSTGKYEEMNAYYAPDFQGWLYMPIEGEVQFFDATKIKEGNKAAADYYYGKKIRFTYSALKIIPQSENQAAVSYEISHQNSELTIRALSLEVWRKEADGKWRMLRWYEEKGEKEKI